MYWIPSPQLAPNFPHTLYDISRHADLSPCFTTECIIYVMAFSRMNPFELIVAPDAMGNAIGDLFWDDGDSVDTIENDAFCVLKFNLTGVSIVRTPHSLDCLFILATCLYQAFNISYINHVYFEEKLLP